MRVAFALLGWEALAQAPTKGPSAGCGDSCDSPGDLDDFDDWNQHGKNGGISKICVKVGAPKIGHSNDWIIRFKACYGGDNNCLQHPGSTGGQDADQCFPLNQGEVITEITGYAGGKPRGEDHGALAKLQIHTSSGRSSTEWGGRHDGTSQFSIKAPDNQHIVAFWGRASGHHVGWNGIIHKLGVYFGQGTTPPGQQTCKDTRMYGYWNWVQMTTKDKLVVTTSEGVTNSDGTGGSTETMHSLSNTEGESFTVGSQPPSETGGVSWSSTTSWSTTQEESTKVSSSWSHSKTVSYSKSCEHTFDQPGHVYQWVWAYYCNNPINHSMPIGQAFDACASMLRVPYKCKSSKKKRCQPLFAPFNCADNYCQKGYPGSTNLKTGKVVKKGEYENVTLV